MNDPRPRITAVQTVPGTGLASAVHLLIGQLFAKADEWHGAQPLDLGTIRISILSDTQVQASARVGYPLCSDCHQPGDRPHTDYCPTRCTCPPEQLILGHAARCPVRAADPWALPAGGVCACGQDYDAPPTPTCTTPDHHDHPSPITTRLPGQSIHPDRGPVCKVDHCAHVYESECNQPGTSCHHQP